MPYKLKFHYGDRVRRLVDNAEGIVVGYCENATTRPMWQVFIPKRKDLAQYEGESHCANIDEVELVLVESSIGSDFSGELNIEFEFNIGQEVEHIYIPDMYGIVISRTACVNGCHSYRLQPMKLEGTRLAPTVRLVSQLLRVVAHANMSTGATSAANIP